MTQRILAKTNNNYENLITSIEELIQTRINNSHTINNYVDNCLCVKRTTQNKLNIPIQYETYLENNIIEKEHVSEVINRIDELLGQFTKTSAIHNFLIVCKISKYILYTLAILITWHMVEYIVELNCINSYVVSYLVGILSCVFLAITLKLILKEWKAMGYVKTKNNKKELDKSNINFKR